MIKPRKRMPSTDADSSNRTVFASPANPALVKKNSQKNTSKRRVIFESMPVVHEITPLEDKPHGLTRMPEASLPKTAEEEVIDNPPTNIEEEEIQPVFEELQNKTAKYEKQSSSFEMASEGSRSTRSRRSMLLKRKPIPMMPLDMVDTVEENACSPLMSDPDSVVTDSPVPCMESRLLLSQQGKSAFNNGVSKKKLAKSQLWTKLFHPQKLEDFFTRDPYIELTDWLSKWQERLQKQTKVDERQQTSNKKRRRSLLSLEAEDSDEDGDEDFEVVGEPIDNPKILHGPSGSGKSAIVYCAAKESNFDIIEISTAEKRDGASLTHKLAGALRSHNVNKGAQNQDIRTLFSPSSRLSSLKRGNNTSASFTLVLIEECELIYSTDRNFWPSLKAICTDARIPIVLTCNDYAAVRAELRQGEPVVASYKAISVERPSTLTFSKYLMHWLVGLTGMMQKVGSLSQLIEEKHGDVRAVLNTLQLGFRSPQSTSSGRFELSEMARNARAASEFDSACGHSDSVSCRSGHWANIDCVDVVFIKDSYAEKEELERLRQSQFRQINSQNDGGPGVNEAVECSVRRSYPDRLYGLRETGMDHLPCLLAIHCAYHRYAHRNYSRRPVHPFDMVNSEGEVIDKSRDLKWVVEQYQFSIEL